VFISVCTCGQGVVGEDRDELARKAAAHLKGDFFPAQHAPADHAAWIGEADAKLSIDVRTEVLP